MRSAAKLFGRILLVVPQVNSVKVHPAVTQYCRLDDWTTFLADSLPCFMSDFALVERNIKFDSEAEGTRKVDPGSSWPGVGEGGKRRCAPVREVKEAALCACDADVVKVCVCVRGGSAVPAERDFRETAERCGKGRVGGGRGAGRDRTRTQRRPRVPKNETRSNQKRVDVDGGLLDARCRRCGRSRED
jgi:hypothetical protein